MNDKAKELVLAIMKANNDANKDESGLEQINKSDLTDVESLFKPIPLSPVNLLPMTPEETPKT